MDRFERMIRSREEHRRRMESGPDSMQVRLALLKQVEDGEITLAEAQAEIRRLAKQR